MTTDRDALHRDPHRAQISNMKLYTVQEANRTLPLVSRIASDIVHAYAKWQDAVREFEIVAAAARADLPNERATVVQAQAQRLAADIAGFVRELDQLGVQFKGYDLGLVDFPSLMGDRTVYLCWRLGEPDIRHWHELDAGFAGRQPIEPLAFV